MWVTILVSILVPLLQQFLAALLGKYGMKANIAASKSEYMGIVQKKFLLGKRRFEVAEALYDHVVARHNLVSEDVAPGTTPEFYANELCDDAKDSVTAALLSKEQD